MNLGKVKQVRFHQAIKVGNKTISSLNLGNKVEGADHDLIFAGGLLKITKKGQKGATYVGLANICYMIVEGDVVIDTPVEKQIVENENVSIEIGDLNAREAIKLVKETEDKDILEAWRDIETRDSVIKAINKKLS